MKYVVKIPCDGFHEYSIEADDSDEAIEAVAFGLGCFLSHDAVCEDVDTNNWEVRKSQ